MIVVSISYQYYNEDRILLTSGDIDSLKVKYEAYVRIEVTPTSIYYYNKLSKGSAILNKLWTPC